MIYVYTGLHVYVDYDLLRERFARYPVYAPPLTLLRVGLYGYACPHLLVRCCCVTHRFDWGVGCVWLVVVTFAFALLRWLRFATLRLILLVLDARLQLRTPHSCCRFAVDLHARTFYVYGCGYHFTPHHALRYVVDLRTARARTAVTQFSSFTRSCAVARGLLHADVWFVAHGFYGYVTLNVYYVDWLRLID